MPSGRGCCYRNARRRSNGSLGSRCVILVAVRMPTSVIITIIVVVIGVVVVEIVIYGLPEVCMHVPVLQQGAQL